MKNKKVIGLIIAANFAVGTTALFANHTWEHRQGRDRFHQEGAEECTCSESMRPGSPKANERADEQGYRFRGEYQTTQARYSEYDSQGLPPGSPRDQEKRSIGQTDLTRLDQDQNRTRQTREYSSTSRREISEPAGAVTGTFDKEMFLQEVGKNGVAEVNMAQLGTQKAQDPQLKDVSMKLVRDHSKLDEQVKELAEKKGVSLSTEIDSKHQGMIDHISGLSGEEFDKAYAMHMVQGHKKSIAKFEQAARSDDSDISRFAKSTLPTLRKHLAMVQKWAPDSSASSSVNEPSGTEKKSYRKNDSDNPNK